MICSCQRYQSCCVCDGCIQADRAARRADGQPRSDGGGGDGARGRGWCGGAGRHGCQRLLAVKQSLTQSREAFLWRYVHFYYCNNVITLILE